MLCCRHVDIQIRSVPLFDYFPVNFVVIVGLSIYSPIVSPVMEVGPADRGDGDKGAFMKSMGEVVHKVRRKSNAMLAKSGKGLSKESGGVRDMT